MIISRTPLRISFCGGGTDFEDYYKINGGAVISTTINKYVYVTIAKKFDGKIHLRYSEIECVDNINQLRHNLIREALRLIGIVEGVEIVIISDAPMTGCGLGSSSSLSVSSLMAFSAYRGFNICGESLTKQACDLEIKILGSPIGKQDQYAVSFGGFNLLIFESNEEVIVNSLSTAKKEKVKWLQDSSMLFYLGKGHSSSEALAEHKNNIKSKMNILDCQIELVNHFYNWLHGDEPNHVAGEIINLNWKYKIEMSPKATNNDINEIIAKILQSGAYGAKVCGAGSSGFLLIICEEEKQKFVRKSLNFLTELDFSFEDEGTKIIYHDIDKEKKRKESENTS